MGSAGVISLMSDGLAGPAVSSEGLACRPQGHPHLAGQQEVQVWTINFELAKQPVDNCQLPIVWMTCASAGCMQRAATAQVSNL